MAIGAFLPLALFVGILGTVGLRLVLLWRRTREIPEMSLGFGLVIVSLSMPVSAIGRAPATAMEPLGRICFAGGLALAVTGIALMVFFNYWVFRRGTAWAKALLVLMGALLVTSIAYMSVANFQGDSVLEIKTVMRPGTLTLMVTILACFAWAALESFRYHAALRRQLVLGLADPVAANRFLLWGVAGATCSILMAVIIACVLTGMTILREPIPLLAIAACGVIMSASWYLTFFAPPGYQRFIRERAARSPA